MLAVLIYDSNALAKHLYFWQANNSQDYPTDKFSDEFSWVLDPAVK